MITSITMFEAIIGDPNILSDDCVLAFSILKENENIYTAQGEETGYSERLHKKYVWMIWDQYIFNLNGVENIYNFLKVIVNVCDPPFTKTKLATEKPENFNVTDRKKTTVT